MERRSESKIEDQSANLKSECAGNQMADFGKNKKNIESLISTFNELKNTFSLEELNQKYETLKPDLVSKEQDVLNQPPATTKEKITGVFAIFKPTDGYFITPILINLKILIFILMVISGVNFMLPDNESLIKWEPTFDQLLWKDNPGELLLIFSTYWSSSSINEYVCATLHRFTFRTDFR
ncbi:MAG: hypothetical protein IPL12_04530 [Bacteroidetes bacterium]|nr:hypothetical protein [Bacteroidota bacterium]